MPLFEYTCDKCKKNFEELVLKQSDIVKCPYCGTTDTQKLISCCQHSFGGGTNIGYTAPSSQVGSGSCSGCSGKSCATCK